MQEAVWLQRQQQCRVGLWDVPGLRTTAELLFSFHLILTPPLTQVDVSSEAFPYKLCCVRV